jgi:hypothetical protein
VAAGIVDKRSPVRAEPMNKKDVEFISQEAAQRDVKHV